MPIRPDNERLHGYRTSKDAEKHERVRRLVRRLPSFREAVGVDLTRSGLGRDRILAVALRMLDHGVFRTGGAQYADEYGSRGAATLLRSDVCVRGGRLLFDFTAKGGQRRVLELDDPELVRAVTALKRSRHDNPSLMVCRAEEIAARTVNKERARSGESKEKSRTSIQDMASSKRGGQRSHQGPGGRTKEQLYADAKRKGIKRRSKMNKSELARAVGR